MPGRDAMISGLRVNVRGRVDAACGATTAEVVQFPVRRRFSGAPPIRAFREPLPCHRGFRAAFR